MKRLNISSNPPTNKAISFIIRYFKPVGVVLLLCRSGTLSSSLYRRQQIRIQHSYRPRIPRVLCPCGLFHTRLRVVVGDVNFLGRHSYFHIPCTPHHQSLLAQSTQRHRRWNTIVCSKRGNYGCEGCHSKRRVGLCCPIFSWKDIPTEDKGKLKKSKQ